MSRGSSDFRYCRMNSTRWRPLLGEPSVDRATMENRPRHTSSGSNDVESSLRDRRPFNCEYRVELPDGAIHTVHGRGELIPGDDGRPARFVETAQVITERKRIDAERAALHQKVLASRERLEVLSRMAGVLAATLPGAATGRQDSPLPRQQPGSRGHAGAVVGSATWPTRTPCSTSQRVRHTALSSCRFLLSACGNLRTIRLIDRGIKLHR